MSEKAFRSAAISWATIALNLAESVNKSCLTRLQSPRLGRFQDSFGEHLRQMWPELACLGPGSVDLWPGNVTNLAMIRPISGDVETIWPELGEIWLDLGQVWVTSTKLRPKSPDVGAGSTKCSHLRWGLARCWPGLARISPMRANVRSESHVERTSVQYVLRGANLDG